MVGRPGCMKQVVVQMYCNQGFCFLPRKAGCPDHVQSLLPGGRQLHPELLCGSGMLHRCLGFDDSLGVQAQRFKPWPWLSTVNREPQATGGTRRKLQELNKPSDEPDADRNGGR